ncbi:MAG: hypothetical protein K0Q60_4796 [Microvirga sp.]|jgi:hypothetical protein|nr:hypothetical protein [Microvirga sp.]
MKQSLRQLPEELKSPIKSSWPQQLAAALVGDMDEARRIREAEEQLIKARLAILARHLGIDANRVDWTDALARKLAAELVPGCRIVSKKSKPGPPPTSADFFRKMLQVYEAVEAAHPDVPPKAIYKKLVDFVGQDPELKAAGENRSIGVAGLQNGISRARREAGRSRR